jgi:hypothetical protein
MVNFLEKISGHTLLEMGVSEGQRWSARGACQDGPGGRRDPVINPGVRSKAHTTLALGTQPTKTNQSCRGLPSIPQPCHHHVGCLNMRRRTKIINTPRPTTSSRDRTILIDEHDSSNLSAHADRPVLPCQRKNMYRS